MKSIKQFSLLILTATLITSCSMNNGFIQKRKYSKGYYLSLKKKNSAALPTNIKTVDIDQELGLVQEQSVNEAPSFTKSNDVKKVTTKVETVEKTTEFSSEKNLTANIVQSNDASPVRNNSIKNTFNNLFPVNAVKNNLATKKPSSTNEAELLLLIVCLFISWLAVGLYTDWDTTPTVINLILWLLFWLPGTIHGYLILLDII